MTDVKNNVPVKSNAPVKNNASKKGSLHSGASKIAAARRAIKNNLLRRTSGSGDGQKNQNGGKSAGREFDWESARQRILQATAALAQGNETDAEILESVWAQRAAQIAQTPAQQEKGDRADFTLVQLGSEVYAIDVEYVFTIRPAKEISRVPRVPEWVTGVANVRGHIMSVIDLKRFFGLAAGTAAPENNLDSKAGATDYLIVVHLEDMEVALLIDDIPGVESILIDKIQDTDGVVRGIPPEYVRGVVRREDPNSQAAAQHAIQNTFITVLNIPALLGDPRLIIHEELV